MSSNTAEIQLTKKQTQAWEAWESQKITELGYGGAAGGGKSRLGCYIALITCEMHPGARYAIGRKELKTLRLTTLTTFFEILSELGYKKDRDFKYDAQQGLITFTNGSEILILDTAYSPQDPEYTRFGSLEITGAFIDESNETPLKAKQILKTRVGRKNIIKGKKVKSFWLETFNPDKGHVYTDYYKLWKDGKLPEYREFIASLPGDNPYLPDEYIQNLKRADKMTRERLLNGNFEYDDDPTRLFDYETLMDMFTNTIEKDNEKWCSVDAARFGQDKIVIGSWDGLELYRTEIYSKKGVDQTIELVKKILAEEQIPFSHCVVDEGGVGGGVVDGLQGAQGFVSNQRAFEVTSSRFGKRMPDNYKNLRSQCFFHLAELVKEHKIAVKCKDENLKDDIIAELVAHKEKDADKDNARAVIGKDEIKEELGRSPDIADMMMMRMYFEFNKKKGITTEQIRAYQQRRKRLAHNQAR